ncbi:MAG: macro domain-containing protein [Parachlamydiales bacterium]|jgi:O-acetyl-ADP-ribose deacetylase (regulator of RNase III)
MFELTRGNLLKANVDALVNTVNTEGVMGKGIALQFRKAYPENYNAYKRACNKGLLKPGQMFTFHCGFLNNPRYIINFPTKRHWRSKSKIEDIEIGLKSLVNEVRQLNITSIAIPPLGCGLGGLLWQEVQPLMRLAFAQLPNVRWLVYEPEKSEIKNIMPRPRMTLGRAVVLGLIQRYLVPGFVYEISLLEIQKLVYFLVEAGEELNSVKYEKGHYGPYSDTIRHVLERINGHFIHGYLTNKPESPITIDPSTKEEINRFLKEHSNTRERFEKVSKLVEGFETPFGMELLATVHWAATREIHGTALNSESILHVIKNWNTRKARVMQFDHVKIALNRLISQGWLPS